MISYYKLLTQRENHLVKNMCVFLISSIAPGLFFLILFLTAFDLIEELVNGVWQSKSSISNNKNES